ERYPAPADRFPADLAGEIRGPGDGRRGDLGDIVLPRPGVARPIHFLAPSVGDDDGFVHVLVVEHSAGDGRERGDPVDGDREREGESAGGDEADPKAGERCGPSPYGDAREVGHRGASALDYFFDHRGDRKSTRL